MSERPMTIDEVMQAVGEYACDTAFGTLDGNGAKQFAAIRAAIESNAAEQVRAAVEAAIKALHDRPRTRVRYDDTNGCGFVEFDVGAMLDEAEARIRARGGEVKP